MKGALESGSADEPAGLCSCARLDPLDVESLVNPVLYDELPVHQHVPDIACAASVNQAREDIPSRFSVRAIESDDDDVRPFARLDRTDQGVEAESARPVDGPHAQNSAGRQRGHSAAHLGQESCVT